MRTSATTLLALLLLAAPAHAEKPAEASPNGDWRVLGSAQGIQLAQREIPGRLMPAFRAVGEVKAGLYDVLAVIYDVERHKEWVHDCNASKLIEQMSPTESFVYHRIQVRWPLTDRDVTLRIRIEEPEPGRHIRISFRNASHEDMPPQRGVTRMPLLEGHYDLRLVDPERVRVEYQVESDPGVNAPRALVVMTAREMPFYTLRNLREQVARTKGRYESFIRDWRNGSGPPGTSGT